MKTVTLLIFLMVFSNVPHLGKDKITSKYNCPIPKDDGRCTGSAYCSACRNCSRCAHCSSGGTCGVCSSSSGYSYTPKKRKSSVSPSYYTSSPTHKTYYKNETIIIYTDLINVREKPNTKAKILEKLTTGDEVIFIEQVADWSKIKVSETGTIGYVYSKLLNQ